MVLNDGDEEVVFKSPDDDDDVNADGPTELFSSEPRQATDGSLSPGPLRFAAEGERSISQQISSLSLSEKQCFDNLKTRWKESHPDKPLSDEMILRFARCSPGANKFNEKTAWRVMQRFDRRYLVLTATRLRSQLLSKTLFPVPGMVTLDGHDMFYMRPSRYFPKLTPTKGIIDNLAYCMTAMMEEEKSCTEGIGFLCYMNDWKRCNFSIEYASQFVKTLQGRIPVRVRVFLIVNPPAWFNALWKLIKPMLFSNFRQKVHLIKEDQLSSFLMPGYETYLPDDMGAGTVSTGELVADFFKYRQYVEEQEHHKLFGLEARTPNK